MFYIDIEFIHFVKKLLLSLFSNHLNNRKIAIHQNGVVAYNNFDSIGLVLNYMFTRPQNYDLEPAISAH